MSDGRYETAIREAIESDGSCERAGISPAFLAVYIRAAIEPLVAAEVAAAKAEEFNESCEVIQPLVDWLCDHEAARYGGRHCIDVAIELLNEAATAREGAS